MVLLVTNELLTYHIWDVLCQLLIHTTGVLTSPDLLILMFVWHSYDLSVNNFTWLLKQSYLMLFLLLISTSFSLQNDITSNSYLVLCKAVQWISFNKNVLSQSQFVNTNNSIHHWMVCSVKRNDDEFVWIWPTVTVLISSAYVSSQCFVMLSCSSCSSSTISLNTTRKYATTSAIYNNLHCRYRCTCSQVHF